MKKLILVFALIGLISCKKESTLQVTMTDDVTFLASDDLQGRKTGTEGELKAANYIKDRFASLGVSPKGNAGTCLLYTSPSPRD